MPPKSKIVPGIKQEITELKYQKGEKKEGRDGGKEEKALFGDKPLDKRKAP